MSDHLNDNNEKDRRTSRKKQGNLISLGGRFKRENLVLPVSVRSSLQDFVFKAQNRMQPGEKEKASMQLQKSSSLFGLIVDEAGTGKTMAAEFIAGQLYLDLYRIDLTAVVNKYIGETSKNLERILTRAAGMDQVLLFDEADALFGKRTEGKDAHDRYAHIDISYFLQALEGYHGIVLFACNKKQNIDPAFIRRMHYVLEFPQPDS